MAALLTSNQRAVLTTTILALLATQVPSCSSKSNTDDDMEYTTGGTPSYRYATGGRAAGGAIAAGGKLNTGGGVIFIGSGGTRAIGGNVATGGVVATGGRTGDGGPNGQYIVSLIQSPQTNASDILEDEIESMVSDAVTQAGGLDFIKDGMTVVLKPNLLSYLKGCWMGTDTLSPTVNGVTTDWRVTKAVAELVRAKDPTGQILVMEGSNRNTTTAFQVLGYTSANFGSSVNAFIPLEGPSGCASRDQTDLVQKPGASGKLYWVNAQYFDADVLISIGAMKTHSNAGITGSVKNLGIGATPNAMYSVSTSNGDCTRNMSDKTQSSYIEHADAAALGAFVADFYSVRPPDFAIMDGLQGLQNGPCSTTYADTDRMNMRLILASKNAVALDTIEALVMNCDPKKVPVLTTAEGFGLGTTDPTRITVVGNKQVADVKKSFKSGLVGVCN